MLISSQIQAISAARKETPRQLFTPFWRSISPKVVRQLPSRPQITQLLSELCDFEVSQFLVVTQAYTLPYLILDSECGVIERIAQANGNMTVKTLCFNKNNMPAILAVLLTQDSGNAENTTIELLKAVSPEFQKIYFRQLIRSDQMMLAGELIKMAGDENNPQNEAKKEKVYEPVSPEFICSSRAYTFIDN